MNKTLREALDHNAAVILNREFNPDAKIREQEYADAFALDPMRMQANKAAQKRVADIHEQETFGPIEKDPRGLRANAPGAKLDAGKVRMGLIFNDMPRALFEVGRVGTFGANKYSDGGWLMVDNGIRRYTDAMDRHRLKEQIEGPFDSESGENNILHAAQIAWNALARLELMLRSPR